MCRTYFSKEKKIVLWFISWVNTKEKKTIFRFFSTQQKMCSAKELWMQNKIHWFLVTKLSEAALINLDFLLFLSFICLLWSQSLSDNEYFVWRPSCPPSICSYLYLIAIPLFHAWASSFFSPFPRFFSLHLKCVCSWIVQMLLP